MHASAHISTSTGLSKKNSGILLINISVNLRHVAMNFVFELVKTLEVLATKLMSQ
jgi:hypothetical protein